MQGMKMSFIGTAMVHRIIALLLAVTIATACASTTQSQAPAGAAPRSAASSPEDKAFIAFCRELLPERLDNMTAAAGRVPTTEATVRVARLFDEAQPCEKKGALPVEDYRKLLGVIREVMGAWYEVSPALRAAALSTDASGLQDIPDATGRTPTLEPVRTGRLLAEYYIKIEQELRRIDPSLQAEAARLKTTHRDGQDLEGDLGVHAMSHAMMRVDAATGVLLNLLNQQDVGGHNAAAAQTTLDILADGLRTEGAIWTTHLIPEGGLQNAEFKPARADGRSVRLANRVYLTSSYVRHIASAWGSKPTQLLRQKLGLPYRGFIEGLYNAEFALKQSPRASTSPPAPAEFQWIVAVEDAFPEGTPYKRFNRLKLERILHEIIFDDYNLRALFDLREAEAEWVRLLGGGRQQPASDAEIVRAAYMLLKGAEYTESAQARIAAVARAVMVTDMLDGKDVNPPPNGTAARDVFVFRQRASRQLAELAVCLMNSAYLKSGSKRRCFIGIDTAASGIEINPTSCNGEALSADFSATSSGVPPLTEEAQLAYQKSLRTIESNWIAPSSDKSGPYSGAVRPSPATICELRSVLHTIALGRMSVDLVTYHHIVSMLADQRFKLPAAQVGPLVSGAVQLAVYEQRAICASVGVVQCSAQDLANAVQAAPADKKRAVGRQRERYCLSNQVGQSLVEKADSSSSGTSLLAYARRYLKPLDEREILAHGRAMKSEAVACTR
jgi:hypothetical protein